MCQPLKKNQYQIIKQQGKWSHMGRVRLGIDHSFSVNLNNLFLRSMFEYFFVWECSNSPTSTESLYFYLIFLVQCIIWVHGNEERHSALIVSFINLICHFASSAPINNWYEWVLFRSEDKFCTAPTGWMESSWQASRFMTRSVNVGILGPRLFSSCLFLAK